MTTLLCKQDPSLTLASQMLLKLCVLPNLCETQSIKRIISVGEWTVTPMAFFCCPHLSQYYFRYSVVITWHGCPFISKNERHLIAKNGVDKYIFLCVGDSFYVDPNARNKIQGSHVCCLYFKLEWQSSKCKAEKKNNSFAPLHLCQCPCGSTCRNDHMLCI